MSVLNQETLVIHRGMSLHKMIRLITLGLGGDVKINLRIC
jgi:1,4-alpha-glucan branching enzyme